MRHRRASRDPSPPTKGACFAGNDVCVLVFHQAAWTRTEAKAWAKRMGFKHGVVTSEGGKWVLPQIPKGRFVPGSFRHAHIERDVHAVVGCPR